MKIKIRICLTLAFLCTSANAAFTDSTGTYVLYGCMCPARRLADKGIKVLGSRNPKTSVDADCFNSHPRIDNGVLKCDTREYQIYWLCSPHDPSAIMHGAGVAPNGIIRSPNLSLGNHCYIRVTADDGCEGGWVHISNTDCSVPGECANNAVYAIGYNWNNGHIPTFAKCTINALTGDKTGC